MWLPVDISTPATAQAARFETLALTAAPAKLGVLPAGSADAVVIWLASTSDVLVELPEPPDDMATRAALVAAAGGPDAWRRRVRTTGLDLDAAGHVVHAQSRQDARLALARARRARFDAGRVATDYPLVVAMPVSIGRTMSEAEARALRDPALATGGDPRLVGLFGRLEDAQQQAMELARSGADAIRATLADESDLADLLAQLRSVTVGPTPVLHARDRG